MVTKDNRINLAFAFRFNRVDPLFRSIAVFTQADKLDNQFELTGSFGEITAGVVHNRLNDNLDNVPSILKTLTRHSGLTLGGPLTSVFGNTHPFSPWLPRLSYGFDRTHAYGAGLTDIMSIPPSVARRAYQAAVDGDTSSFFYVRRFINTAGGPDEFVNVTCRMSGGGPRTPFSLTDVKLSFAIDKPIMLLKVDERVPPIKAEIAYNGTGRLKGRWEVVLPGEDAPSDTDLLTEATLPIEERAQQRRYTQLSTFNVFLAPNGKYILPGPDVLRLPNAVSGEYLLLLRIEATDEKESDSNLAVVGVGSGVVHSGAVAGFPLPVLRYYVGSGPDKQFANDLTLLFPDDKMFLSANDIIEFKWSDTATAAFYRLEVVDMAGQPVLSAVLLPGKGFYRAPPWLKEKPGGGNVRWRVLGLERNGQTISESPWRNFRIQGS